MNATRKCILCDGDGATLRESLLVMMYADDERGYMAPEMVHMMQPKEYWFSVEDTIEEASKLAWLFASNDHLTPPSNDNQFEAYGCHLTCYMEFLLG